MRVIHVLRKPLSEKSVAANVMTHGTGAINVDASRVTLDGPSPSVERRKNKAPGLSVGATGWTTPARPPSYNEQRSGELLGRWPANVVLQHLPGCRCTGSTKIKGVGPGHGGGFKDGKFSGGAGLGGYTGTTFPGFADEDGNETVAVWDCAPGCPVAALDEQSGDLHSQDPASRKGRLGKHGTGAGTTYLSVKETGNHYGDSGGASRFFKQIGGDDE